MHTTETCLEQTPPFANSFALFSFSGRRDGDAPKAANTASLLVEEARQHAHDSAQLLREISVKAPQLASVLEQLNEGSAPARIEFDEAPAGNGNTSARRFGAARVLETVTGLLSHAFPANAPLFHGGLAFLQLKMIKKKKQA
ncbi:hypothetical protein [Herbaspirillum robiniae]|uniref:Uncharacterized protein n=1 Tax=Herbaspirillum robiniae TaxID=2014887 RepID=A0A2D0B6Z4_9BURK|nr:hypothetical protein [Herbaspirillum robiniae]OWY29891.1 hypothetical protein CEJ42_08565 [Herbaspirillum robiniae]